MSAGEHTCVLQATGFRRRPSRSRRSLRTAGSISTGSTRPAGARDGRFSRYRAPITKPASSSRSRRRRRWFTRRAVLSCRTPFSRRVGSIAPLRALGADALALSAHKLGGPKGSAPDRLRDAALSLGDPLIRGGGQERGRARARNVAAIAGFGAAARGRAAGEPNGAGFLRSARRLADRVREIAPDVVIFGEESPRLPNTLCFAVPDPGGDPDDRARSRRRRRQLGIGLLFGQGRRRLTSLRRWELSWTSPKGRSASASGGGRTPRQPKPRGRVRHCDQQDARRTGEGVMIRPPAGGSLRRSARRE